MFMGQKKRSPLIPLDFQIKFLLKFLLAVLIAFVTASLILYLLVNGKLGETYFSSINFLNYLNRNLIKYLLYSLSFQFIFIALLTLFITLFASHRIAGPLIRLEKICRQIGQGELPASLRIRAKDQIKGLAQSMAHFIQELRRRIKNIVVHKENIEEMEHRINRLLEEGRFDSVQKEFEIIGAGLKAIEKILESFKVE